jgi:Domain of unknown function (DUF1883)
MNYRFKYAYYDLGQLQEGDTVVVRLRGAAPNVLLLDSRNFSRYRAGMRFSYIGGRRSRSPARLTVPRDDHWFVALDLGGRPGRVQGAVSVQRPGREESPVARAV